MYSKLTNPGQSGNRASRWKRTAAVIAALASLMVSRAAMGAEPTTAPADNGEIIATGVAAHAVDAPAILQMMVGKSAVLGTHVPVKRVNVASPDVADVNPIGPQSLLVTAKKAGTSQVILWDDNDHSQTIEVEVAFNLKEVEGRLATLFPDSHMEVSYGGGTLALRGHVPSLEIAKQAVEVVTPYGKVLNLLEISGGQQVQLEVRFAEVSRSATSQLGVNFGFADGHSFGASTIGGVNGFNVSGAALTAASPGAGITMFGRAEMGNTALDVFVAALRQNNLLRTLADPKLTVMSGQEANFLAGGEFPIPVPQSGGSSGGTAITVEYKEFGVRLKFTPVVMGDGRIRLKVAPEVSDLDFSSPVSNQGFIMPIINKRSLMTTIELNEGQTFALAGLLNSSAASSNQITPGLGDLPVLGALFRSVRYQRKETELLVLVTPRIVEAMNPAQANSIPGEKWRHPSENELFMDGDLGGPLADNKQGPTTRSTASTGPAPRFQGSYGFQPVADSGH